MHKSLEDVWDYLTNQYGHQDLWLREDPIPPRHKISAVLIRYSHMPVIVTGTKRILAYKDLTAGVWVYIGNPLSPLDQEINWLTEPTKIRLDKGLCWQYSLTGY
ncbi:hypothetical protein EH536_20715 [Escherichia coli]|nr:hypothetical protein [Escherichia coli]